MSDALTSNQVRYERLVQMSPAFDKRHPDPKRNYGIHGVDLRMILKGPEGAVQFVLYTNWQLPHVAQETVNRIENGASRIAIECAFMPMPADLGYHWTKPRYDGQTQMDCEYVACGKCYYDGSTMNAERIYEVLLREGSEGVWRELESFYNDLVNRDDC